MIQLNIFRELSELPEKKNDLPRHLSLLQSWQKMAENNEELGEFSSVVIPVFTDFANAFEENQDSSISSPIETLTETPSESVVEGVDSRIAENESSISPNKRTRTDLREDVMDDETMVEVTVADWLRFYNPTSTPSADLHNQDDDVMWNDRLATLVDDIEGGLRDEEGSISDENDDELTEINEGFTYGPDHVGNDTSTTPNLSDEEREQGETAEDSDKKPVYPTATVAVGTIMVLLALFTIKHNLPAEAIGNLLSLISLALPSSHCLPNTVSRFKNYFKKLRNPLCIHYYCTFCLAHIELCVRMADASKI